MVWNVLSLQDELPWLKNPNLNPDNNSTYLSLVQFFPRSTLFLKPESILPEFGRFIKHIYCIAHSVSNKHHESEEKAPITCDLPEKSNGDVTVYLVSSSPYSPLKIENSYTQDKPTRMSIPRLVPLRNQVFYWIPSAGPPGPRLGRLQTQPCRPGCLSRSSIVRSCDKNLRSTRPPMVDSANILCLRCRFLHASRQRTARSMAPARLLKPATANTAIHDATEPGFPVLLCVLCCPSDEWLLHTWLTDHHS